MTYLEESALYKIFIKIWGHGHTRRKAEIIIDPLNYYFSTGRASGSECMWLRRATERQLATVARRLEKAGGNYDIAINSCKEYISNFTEEHKQAVVNEKLLK